MRLFPPWILAAVIAASGCAEGVRAERAGAPLWKEIREAPRARRATIGMLSVPVDHATCGAEPAGTFALRCDGPPAALDGEWAAIGGRIASAVESGADPDAMHAAALLDLISGGAGNSLDRSISYLEMTSRISPSADRLVDLSAGYLARSGRDRDARSLIAALDAAARAAQLDPASTPARFNLAIALRELGLFEAARTELGRFRELEGESPWAEEALRYSLELAIDTIVVPSDSAVTPETIAAFARRHSNEARSYAWDRLAAWARAFPSGDAPGGEHHLRLAEAAGRAIHQDHLDPSIADAVTAIRQAGPTGRAALAAAHLSFSEGQTLARSGKAVEADRAYQAAARIGDASPALAAWATYGQGNNRLALQDPKGAESVMRRLLASPAASRYPALSARLHWTLGVILLRGRTLQEGTRYIGQSRDLYTTLGETEYRASMTGLLGEVANLRGDPRAAYAHFAEALHMFREYPLSVWRHNNLLLMSRAAAADGFDAAAAAIDMEDDAASRAAKRVPSLVESSLSRARLARSRGDSAGAAQALSDGRRLAEQLPPGSARSQLETELRVEETDLAATEHEMAMAALDSAVEYFSRIRNYSKQLRAYSARAAMSIRRGDWGRADADLDEALSIYGQQRDSLTDPTQRSLLAQQARRVADALTMLRISRGDARGALSARERTRESRVALVRGGASDAPTIELAMIADTLVAFTVRGDSVTVTTSIGEREGLRSDIELLDVALQRGAPEAVWEPILERLHERLIQPVASRLTPSDAILTIIADGMLSRVPFAALRDAKDGSYLVDRHALRFTSSLRQAGDHRAPMPDAPRALLVADPVLDRRSYPELAPLPNAGREVDSIAAIFGRPRILRGADVDTTRLKAALQNAEVFHFAGHAIFDDARPQRSQLAIGGRGLTASAIAQMKLRSLRLVVLSACETNRAPTGIGAGFMGLTESFIAAGAGGVVGSLWKVNDEATRKLMQAFYAAMPRTRDPVLALREAQRSMRDLPPSAWGAFRYAGR
ncbi:MAG TPA: CHAT domain-containing protein [Gemmatimonadaceae bacterium]|nr:CHAT domain-containing protein [Gemmatimonadaceae bacterium]